jgi:hypothetical protein
VARGGTPALLDPSLPHSVSINRERGTTTLTSELVTEIGGRARLFESRAGNTPIGGLLSKDAYLAQRDLLRLLRTHAALVAPATDADWRTSALEEVWKTHGFTVDGFHEIPAPSPIGPGTPRTPALDTSGLVTVPEHPALPLHGILNDLIEGARRKESRLHPWLRERMDTPPPPGPPRYVMSAGGVLVPEPVALTQSRPNIMARFDLPAIAALATTQLEGLVHQIASANGYRVGIVPKARQSLRFLRTRGALPSELQQRLDDFFREGMSSPRFRFAHGAIGSVFLPDNVSLAEEATRALAALTEHAVATGWVQDTRASWWWHERGWYAHSVGFIRHVTERHTRTVEMIDHLYDVPKLFEDIAPNYRNFWRLAITAPLLEDGTYTSTWGLAHLVIPLVETITRNLAEVFGFRILKVARRGRSYRFNVALLDELLFANKGSRISEDFLLRFWPSALRARDDKRLLAVFLRVRNALAHGEILALDLRGIDVLRLGMLVGGVFTWPLRLGPESL